MINIKGKRLSRGISAGTLFFFLASNISWGLPVSGLSVIPVKEVPGFLQIEIPPDLASIEEVYEAPPKPDPQLVLHIQNLHGNESAQTQIKKLLGYLYEKYGFKMLFVEGAVEELNPEYLRLFPDKERNIKLAEALVKQGELTGVEYYLMDGPSDVRAIGIEKAELYRANYEAFRNVYENKGRSDVFLATLDGKLQMLATRIFPQETRRILSEWKKFEAGHRDFLPFVKRLAQDSKRVLGLDLESLFAQVEWPQITRLLVIQAMEKELSREGAMAERSRLVEFLKTKQVSPEIINAVEKLGERKITVSKKDDPREKLENLPRYLFERLVEEAGPKGFYFHDYPAFSLWAGHLILESELDSKLLFEEIHRVFEKILAELAVTEPQKNLLELYHDGELLRKLFALEVSRKEWERVLYRREWMDPGIFVERLLKMEQALPKTNGLAPGTPGFPASMPIPGLTETFTTALDFYDYARKREDIFYDTIEREMSKGKTAKAVLVTGGFHTDGIMEKLREREINYSVLMPKITGVLDNSNYISAMLENRQTLFDLATLEAVVKQQDGSLVIAQGGSTRSEARRVVNEVIGILQSAKNLVEVRSALEHFAGTRYVSSRQLNVDVKPLEPNEQVVTFGFPADTFVKSQAYDIHFSQLGKGKIAVDTNISAQQPPLPPTGNFTGATAPVSAARQEENAGSRSEAGIPGKPQALERSETRSLRLGVAGLTAAAVLATGGVAVYQSSSGKRDDQKSIVKNIAAESPGSGIAQLKGQLQEIDAQLVSLYRFQETLVKTIEDSKDKDSSDQLKLNVLKIKGLQSFRDRKGIPRNYAVKLDEQIREAKKEAAEISGQLPSMNIYQKSLNEAQVEIRKLLARALEIEGEIGSIEGKGNKPGLPEALQGSEVELAEVKESLKVLDARRKEFLQELEVKNALANDLRSRNRVLAVHLEESRQRAQDELLNIASPGDLRQYNNERLKSLKAEVDQEIQKNKKNLETAERDAGSLRIKDFEIQREEHIMQRNAIRLEKKMDGLKRGMAQKSEVRADQADSEGGKEIILELDEYLLVTLLGLLITGGTLSAEELAKEEKNRIEKFNAARKAVSAVELRTAKKQFDATLGPGAAVRGRARFEAALTILVQTPQNAAARLVPEAIKKILEKFSGDQDFIDDFLRADDSVLNRVLSKYGLEGLQIQDLKHLAGADEMPTRLTTRQSKRDKDPNGPSDLDEPRSEVRMGQSVHANIFYIALTKYIPLLAGNKTTPSFDEIDAWLKDKRILNIGLETSMPQGDAFTTQNLVSVLRGKGLQAFGLDPAVTPEKSLPEYFQGKVQQIPENLKKDPFDIIAIPGLMKSEYLQELFKNNKSTDSLAFFYEKSAKEIAGVLKPGGLVFIDLGPAAERDASEKLQDAFKKSGFDVIVLNKGANNFVFIKRSETRVLPAVTVDFQQLLDAEAAIRGTLSQPDIIKQYNTAESVEKILLAEGKASGVDTRSALAAQSLAMQIADNLANDPKAGLEENELDAVRGRRALAFLIYNSRFHGLGDLMFMSNENIIHAEFQKKLIAVAAAAGRLWVKQPGLSPLQLAADLRSRDASGILYDKRILGALEALQMPSEMILPEIKPGEEPDSGIAAVPDDSEERINFIVDPKVAGRMRRLNPEQGEIPNYINYFLTWGLIQLQPDRSQSMESRVRNLFAWIQEIQRSPESLKLQEAVKNAKWIKRSNEYGALQIVMQGANQDPGGNPSETQLFSSVATLLKTQTRQDVAIVYNAGKVTEAQRQQIEKKLHEIEGTLRGIDDLLGEKIGNRFKIWVTSEPAIDKVLAKSKAYLFDQRGAEITKEQFNDQRLVQLYLGTGSDHVVREAKNLNKSGTGIKFNVYENISEQIETKSAGIFLAMKRSQVGAEDIREETLDVLVKLDQNFYEIATLLLVERYVQAIAAELKAMQTISAAA